MDAFREVLGRLPTGVTVIAARTENGPIGVACNSFTSVSLEPPMVGFFVAKTSETWPHIRRAGNFAANVLRSGQADLCRTFAEKGADRFAGVDWSEGSRGAPRIHGAAAWIECELAEVTQTGDHWFALGQVHDLEAAEGADALVFFGGGYHPLVA
jgi:3-hydroxy-9,10-secoandrosta-1,3,5(10)-triene-9,17-dione monooxygenase reductase component